VEFLKRHYVEASRDGWYRFSADIQIKDGEVEVEIPILTRLSDVRSPATIQKSMRSDPLRPHLPQNDVS
jgi:hypothetical protein